MKKLLIGLLVTGTVTAFASSEKVQIDITADTKELCQQTSDSVDLTSVESDLREAGAYVKSMSICKKRLDGKFRQTVKFVKPNL